MDEKYGDVTTYKSVAGIDSRTLELKLGYHLGRLDEGYTVWELDEAVSVGDFLWGDRTAYSGGYQYRYGKKEYRHRFDIMCDEVAKQFKNDKKKTEEWIKAFLRKEADKLNVRQGPDRIVKIFPVTKHDPERFWLSQYPNSNIRGTQQWTILEDRKKKFKQVATIPPGGIYR